MTGSGTTQAARWGTAHETAPQCCRIGALAELGHDLVQPVHAMQLLVHQLQAVSEESARQELVTQLQGVSETIASMFRNLLDCARLDAGSLQPCLDTVRLSPLLARVLGDHAIRCRPRNLRLGMMGSTALWVRADPMLLDRILDNLLDNAVKFTPSGQVVVHCSRKDATVRIEIADTGVGMVCADVDNAQRPFFRGASAHELGLDGMGLGLANATVLARLMGGDVALRSAPGLGTTVVLTLPSAP